MIPKMVICEVKLKGGEGSEGRKELGVLETADFVPQNYVAVLFDGKYY